MIVRQHYLLKILTVVDAVFSESPFYSCPEFVVKGPDGVDVIVRRHNEDLRSSFDRGAFNFSNEGISVGPDLDGMGEPYVGEINIFQYNDLLSAISIPPLVGTLAEGSRGQLPSSHRFTNTRGSTYPDSDNRSWHQVHELTLCLELLVDGLNGLVVKDKVLGRNGIELTLLGVVFEIDPLPFSSSSSLGTLLLRSSSDFRKNTILGAIANVVEDSSSGTFKVPSMPTRTFLSAGEILSLFEDDESLPVFLLGLGTGLLPIAVVRCCRSKRRSTLIERCKTIPLTLRTAFFHSIYN
ncbi:replication-associated protein [Blackfly DNA Virus 2]|nr:replication-associated protein [Blackfly DNA Virus 2]